eukprot:TRINITY_DN5306_c0_g1_i1.p4 TRINITY_DN5306_c0_g1~~TRINITY_DN5306_c0_g1_i1.p4  ORF type:complete len:121 (+),score=21.30 TRINITY_DN5306_c0_g1_i1:251-613(+)
MCLEEYYKETWDIRGEEEDQLMGSSLTEILNAEREDEEEEETVTLDYKPATSKHKRRRIDIKPPFKKDQIPRIHLQAGKIPGITQMHVPPIVTEEIMKKYANKFKYAHIENGFGRLCKAG